MRNTLPAVLSQPLAMDEVSSILRGWGGNAGDEGTLRRDDFHEVEHKGSLRSHVVGGRAVVLVCSS